MRRLPFVCLLPLLAATADTASAQASSTFDFDTIPSGENAPDLTQVNQIGIQANTGNCTPNPG